jgi:hypothetical protein
MRPRTRALVALLGLALAGGGIGGGLYASSAGHGAGPLGPPADEPTTKVGVPADPGEPVSIGSLRVTNSSKHAVTIEAVRLVDADPEIHLLGAYVVPAGAAEIGAAYGFPVPRPAWLLHVKHPPRVPGAQVPPGPGQTDIILGISLSAYGEHSFRAVAIDYVSPGHHYRAVYPAAAVLCAPRSAGPCRSTSE